MNTPLLTLIVLVHNVVLLKKNKHRQTGNTTKRRRLYRYQIFHIFSSSLINIHNNWHRCDFIFVPT